jgi:hypothetical protein
VSLFDLLKAPLDLADAVVTATTKPVTDGLSELADALREIIDEEKK